MVSVKVTNVNWIGGIVTRAGVMVVKLHWVILAIAIPATTPAKPTRIALPNVKAVTVPLRVPPLMRIVMLIKPMDVKSL